MEDALTSVQDFLSRHFPSAAAGAGASHARCAVNCCLLRRRGRNRLKVGVFREDGANEELKVLQQRGAVGTASGCRRVGAGVGRIPVLGEAGMLSVPFPARKVLLQAAGWVSGMFFPTLPSLFTPGFGQPAWVRV